MNKLLKIVLGIVAVVVVLIVAAVIYTAVFFNANDYRGQIESRVQKVTGRSLQIGSIHLSVFPTLGLKLSKTSLANAKGFGKVPFAKVGEADIGVRLLPLLLHRKLEVGTVYLSGLQLNLSKNASGKSNWADLVKSRAHKKVAAKPGEKSGNAFTALNIKGIDISNAAVRYHDAKAGRDLTLDDFNFTLGSLRPGRPGSFSTRFNTSLNQPAVKAQIESSGTITFNIKQQHYQLQAFTLRVTASGKSIPAGKQTIRLRGDADYDGARHSAHLADTVLSVAGLTIHTSVKALGLGSKHLSYSGPIRVSPFNPRRVMSELGMQTPHTADGDVLKRADFNARFSGGNRRVALRDIKLMLDKTTVTGALDVTSLAVPAVDFTLKANAIDADRYLPPVRSGGTPAASTDASANVDSMRIPVKSLDGFTARGSLSLGKLTLHGVKMSNVSVAVNAAKGAAKHLDLKAKLYGGGIDSKTRILPGSSPAYRENLKLAGVNLGPLMKDATGKDPVTGSGDITANLTSNGNTVGQLKRALDGRVAVNLRNGAINGFNLGKILRSLNNLKQQGVKAVINGQTKAEQKTDFTALSVSGTINDGVLTSNDLSGASPLLRLSGAGTVNLVAQTVDYTIKPMVVNTATGQGGKSLSELHGIEVPVAITGPFNALRYRVDLREAIKQKAAHKLRQHFDREKKKLLKKVPANIQNTLKNLFGGGK